MGLLVTFHFVLRLLKSSAVNSPHFTSRLDCEMSGNICKTKNKYLRTGKRVPVSFGFAFLPFSSGIVLSVLQLERCKSWQAPSCEGWHECLGEGSTDEELACGWFSGSTALCLSKATKSGFWRNKRKYIRLEQGPGNG